MALPLLTHPAACTHFKGTGPQPH